LADSLGDLDVLTTWPKLIRHWAPYTTHQTHHGMECDATC
jgi:hypothetical protein